MKSVGSSRPSCGGDVSNSLSSYLGLLPTLLVPDGHEALTGFSLEMLLGQLDISLTRLIPVDLTKVDEVEVRTDREEVMRVRF